MDLPKAKELTKPIHKRSSVNPIDSQQAIENKLIIDKPKMKTPRLSMGSPQQI